MEPTFQIRPARATDIQAIFDLVFELAVYEREPEAVVTTPEEYLADFENKRFEALVAESSEGKVVGMALYYWAYSTWKGKMLYLEDFVVQELYRRYGVGQLIFDAFLEVAKRENCRLVKWQVLDWNEPALRFYEKNKAIIEQGWWNGKLFFNQ